MGAASTAQRTVGVPGLADAALSSIEGHRAAKHLLHALGGGCAPADLVLQALMQVQAHGDAARLRGFCRALQKRLEHAA